jgi:hypothetical protein
MLIRPGMDGSESARNHPASAISVGSSVSSPVAMRVHANVSAGDKLDKRGGRPLTET